jgi:predicted urease superfamily metal-dependent hydrolase
VLEDLVLPVPVVQGAQQALAVQVVQQAQADLVRLEPVAHAQVSLVVPVAQVTVQRRHEQELRRSLREIRQGIDAYKKAFDEGRVARAVGATGYPPN